jgi:PAS domain S-box-containing protein
MARPEKTGKKGNHTSPLPGTPAVRDAAGEPVAALGKSSSGPAGMTQEALIHELRVHQLELEVQGEELRQAYRALEESRDKYLDLYDFAPLGYLTLSDKALITDAGAVLLGEERKKIISRGLGRYIAAGDREHWDSFFADLRQSGEKKSCTLQFVRADGLVFPARLEGVRIATPGEPFIIRITFSDITDIWQIEAFKESSKKYSALFELGSEALFLIDNENGIILEANMAACEMYGYPKQVLLTMKNTDLSAEKDETRKFTTGTQRGIIRIPLRYHVRSNGTPIPVEIMGRFFTWNDRPVHIAAIRDISERIRVEEALHLANRKLTLLSSITRHDISNQLLSLNGFTVLLHREVTDPLYEGYFTRITAAIEQITAMIQFTREYEKIGVKDPVWQDCHSLADVAGQQVPTEGIRVINEIPAGTEVFADPLIARACHTLVDNAVRHGGRITTVRFFSEDRDGVHVVVCEDDGAGVPADEKERIFDRGFGKNTGLGLTLAREILSITGITIRETGEPGKGARFEMTVPSGAWRRRKT